MNIDRRFGLLALGMSLLFFTISSVSAADRIVAIGASNTEGHGVGAKAAYPSQLETLLKAKGYNVEVKNAGVFGDTTGDMLKRLSTAVPDGTKLVIIQPGGNDKRHGISGAKREANIEQMTKQLGARGVKSIRMDKAVTERAAFKKLKQGDGVHLTAKGHALMAEKLLPSVTAALGPPH